ncbi:MAG: PDZ domain-containing protein [Bacilli bacterium]|nr:PDZ domain-containing protein [Bacilli bacterium]
MKKMIQGLEEYKDSLIDLINNEFKYLTSLLAIAIVCFIPVNYYILVGGGISDIGSRVKVENSYKSKGSLNISYVSETQGIFLTYVLSYIMPNWKRLEAEDLKMNNKEGEKEVEFRNYLNLDESSSSALKVSYERAGKEVKLVKSHIYVIGILESAEDCQLQVGDEILSMDGKEMEIVDYSKYISEKKVNDMITIKVLRNKKEKEVKTKVYQGEDRPMIGIYMNVLNEYETVPKATIKFKKSESGPSGGLMTALSLYDQLVEEDITKGYKIAGTGTIDDEGYVGSIGEVKYKVIGAVAGKADVFLVPAGENYEDAKEVVEEQKLKIKLIPVKTFDQALKELSKLK